MARAFRTDMARACGGYGLATGVMAFVIAGCLGVLGDLVPVLSGRVTVEAGYWSQLAQTALASEMALLVVPAAAALPFAASFVDDASTKYLRHELVRVGRRQMAASRTLSCALSGALVLAIGVVVLCGILALLVTPLEIIPQIGDGMSASEAARAQDAAMQRALLDLLGRTLLFALSGALWAVVGSLMATATMSRHMAWAAPFILYYALVILTQRYWKDAYVIDPQEWLSPSARWNISTIWPVALIAGEACVICSLAHALLLWRRARDV